MLLLPPAAVKSLLSVFIVFRGQANYLSYVYASKKRMVRAPDDQ